MRTQAAPNDLDFSSAFLFSKTTPIAPARRQSGRFPESFYRDGYAVLEDIASTAEAETAAAEVIAGIDPRRLPLFARFAGRIQLASRTCIPTCAAIVETTFQGLHFDMGLPVVSPSPQVVQLALALYCPADGTRSRAATRVVPLRRMLSRRAWPEPAELERRIISYTRAFGDGWLKPTMVNTLRLSCCGRLVDAADASEALSGLRDVATGLEFRDPGNDDQASLRNEYRFFTGHGLDVASAEEQFSLRPGQLLVVDNVRAAHGRIGKRQPRELWHYLFGVPSATPEDIDAVRREIIAQFAPA